MQQNYNVQRVGRYKCRVGTAAGEASQPRIMPQAFDPVGRRLVDRGPSGKVDITGEGSRDSESRGG